jgi:hypothetical protein
MQIGYNLRFGVNDKLMQFRYNIIKILLHVVQKPYVRTGLSHSIQVILKVPTWVFFSWQLPSFFYLFDNK